VQAAGQTKIRESDHIVLQNLLRSLRKEAKLSQQELASRLGKPQSYVSKYESGERRIDILELREICIATNTSLASVAKRLEELLSGND
jgi:transcriptional regulator with XRE-family HTH domain